MGSNEPYLLNHTESGMSIQIFLILCYPFANSFILAYTHLYSRILGFDFKIFLPPGKEKPASSDRLFWFCSKRLGQRGFLQLCKRLIEIGNDILDVFKPDRKPHKPRLDACRCKLFVGQLAVGLARGVQHAGADIGDMHLVRR